MSDYLAQLETALGTLPAALADTLPLAIGVKEALTARLEAAGMPPADARTLARQALGHHCSRTSYRAAVATEGAERHDLDGKPVEPVSGEHAMVAALVLSAQANTELTRALRQTPRAEPKPQPKAEAKEEPRYPLAPKRPTSAAITVRPRR